MTNVHMYACAPTYLFGIHIKIHSDQDVFIKEERDKQKEEGMKEMFGVSFSC